MIKTAIYRGSGDAQPKNATTVKTMITVSSGSFFSEDMDCPSALLKCQPAQIGRGRIFVNEQGGFVFGTFPVIQNLRGII